MYLHEILIENDMDFIYLIYEKKKYFESRQSQLNTQLK